LGMRAVVNLLDYFAARRQQKVTLVVSTTGDTGPAAVQAVQDANSPRLSILVHYPSGQISDFQRKQLTTVDSSRVQVVAFQGGGVRRENTVNETVNVRSQYNIARTRIARN
jgi:threonine synthase